VGETAWLLDYGWLDDCPSPFDVAAQLDLGKLTKHVRALVWRDHVDHDPRRWPARLRAGGGLEDEHTLAIVG
jgi:hypothetical protein